VNGAPARTVERDPRGPMPSVSGMDDRYRDDKYDTLEHQSTFGAGVLKITHFYSAFDLVFYWDGTLSFFE
jgi:hypothetical protein